MTTTAPIVADAISEARVRGMGPLEYLQSRGYVQDVSDPDGLCQAFAAGVVTAYVGFDPTAPSLHVGHMLGMMMLASLQRFGHRPIALGGGGTALVGDPSGKTSTRAIVSEEEIRSNLERILPQFAALPRFRREPLGRQSAGIVAQQCRLATPAALHSILARYRPAFLRQRDVGRRDVPHAGWRRPGSTSWSSTTGWCRPTTSSTSSAPRAARCRWAAPTSGEISSPASN